MPSLPSLWTRQVRLPELSAASTLARPQRWAAWALGRPATIACVATIVAVLACWIPHYLTWPWWPDQDHFATTALAWWRGALRPYREIPSFQFPGEYYGFVVLGNVFGWGRTVPLYAVDAASVVALGVALAAWSRAQFGRALPGLVGYLSYLFYYLSLGYEQVAQRDWHATLLAVLALMAAECWRSPRGRAASAIAFGLALTIRPHMLVLVPAMGLALDQGARRPGERPALTARAWAWWGLACGLTLVVTFAPLYLNGLLGDFVRGVRSHALQSEYNRLSARTFPIRFRAQFQARPYLGYVPVAAALLALAPGRRHGRAVATWILALGGALLCKPLSPVDHNYFNICHVLVASVVVAVLIGLLLEARILSPAARLLAIAYAMSISLGPWPTYSSWSHSLRALPSLARGEIPVDEPFCGDVWARPWGDYRSLLLYLRQNSPPGTYVANILPNVPSITAPIAALPPMPGESLSWFFFFKKGADSLGRNYARRLEASPATFAVWAPDGMPFGYPFPEPLAEVVRRDYEPVARFGPYEVRRRKPSSRPKAGPADVPAPETGGR